MRQVASAIIIAALQGATPAARSADLTPPRLQHEPCTTFTWGSALIVRVEIEDESPLFDPKVLFRVSPTKRWESQPLLATNSPSIYEATIPAEALTSDVEYFVQVFDERGNGPARVGSVKEPILVHATAQGDCPTLAETRGTAPDQEEKPTGGTPTGPHEEVVREAEAREPHPETVGSVVVSPPPAPAPSGCAHPGAPVWCSPWFWGGVGVALLAGGAVTWVLLSGEDISSATEADVVISAPYPQAGP